ncbi:DUF4351 domain-containing protein [Cyanobium sp. BA5m-10]|nr:DUF4351 domain-containing protein [Cyanobium sp. BA5m-10]MCP9903058.1 DUF4351 domain-containing protein [Cyanobium sp. BA5m-10]
MRRFPTRSIPEACAMGGITAQIETLAEALLDFHGQDDLAAWFAALP